MIYRITYTDIYIMEIKLVFKNCEGSMIENIIAFLKIKNIRYALLLAQRMFYDVNKD